MAALLRPLATGSWKSSTRFSYLVFAAFGILLFLGSSLYLFPTGYERRPVDWGVIHEAPGAHPIDYLIVDANDQWLRILAQESHDVKNASSRYRQRRGRHPPPGFDKWFEFARSKDAIMVEDFFDQIYDDLSPYWGMSPEELRRQASGQTPRIVVRNNNATNVGQAGPAHWMEAWLEMVSGIQEYLPDLDMPVNGMDESRIITPWETIAEYTLQERSKRRLVNATEIVSEYMTLPDPKVVKPELFEPIMGNPGVWNMVRASCPPDSPSRNSNMPTMDFANPPAAFNNYLNISEDGYVKNWTLSKDPCVRPELQSLHGTFIEPITVRSSTKLFPLFGGSKLPVNNEILIPPAMYWADDPLYSGGEDHGGSWSDKKDVFFWRGLASGGRNREETWTGFQRHRFVSMINGTQVGLAQSNDSHFVNFRLPDYDYYQLASGRAGKLPEFLDNHTDVGFTGLACFPNTHEPFCDYTDPYFSLKPKTPMKEMYANKYLPDIDGNSFSGRYRAFLLSTSLPIKATIYNEWHDSRLIPWAHFVPMDSTFMDIYGLMEYFLGFEGDPGHDSIAKKIAMDGKSWAERVLRREDMQIYVYRLLLEYARICDDRRDVLGYVDDLR
ncbi:predicted protein [Aspergillus terreus NIH2624]|uniref:Glycosyl transferase CAP10 domain-containing protein n=1 Tax=Aspergillus terreus (strain NIH 2624 / FGSC A1156) TaxID=341663 RepID=Q0CFI6_ASPTN|nr:uncharacterized protein ATEG_07548 [Aspergillus terreus NIH2624]EAU31810.1 predicted protein [Aspergillus terreus NIH2624]